MYYCKEMVKILKCYLIPKKSYGTLSKGAIFLGQPCKMIHITLEIICYKPYIMLVATVVNIQSNQTAAHCWFALQCSQCFTFTLLQC